jgi:hypothetical protein
MIGLPTGGPKTKFADAVPANAASMTTSESRGQVAQATRFSSGIKGTRWDKGGGACSGISQIVLAPKLLCKHNSKISASKIESLVAFTF